MKSASINQVFFSYELLQDALKVTQKTVRSQKSNPLFQNLLQKTHFIGKRESEEELEIERVKQNLTDLTIVGIMAHFERELRSDLIQRIRNVSGQSDSIQINLMGKTEESIERWKFEHLLDIYKPADAEYQGIANVIGNLKKAIQYRNWIAHGKNPDSKIPDKIDPGMLYRQIDDFFKYVSEAPRPLSGII